MPERLDGAAPSVGPSFPPGVWIAATLLLLGAGGAVFALGSSEPTRDPIEQIRMATARPLALPEPAAPPPVAKPQAPVVVPPAALDDSLERRLSPAVLFNQAAASAPAETDSATAAARPDPVARFTARYTGEPEASRTIMTGRTIPATLITEVDSTLPGPIVAVVSQPVYGETGRVPLLPAGTRLYGRTNADVRTGESRVAAIWTRAIAQRPDGSTMQIDLLSSGTDQLGTVGMDGYVDTHFWEIFGNSILLSLFAGGVSAVPDGGTGADSINVAQHSVVRGLQSTSRSVLGNQLTIPPTVHVAHGAAINVIVQQDLVFEPDQLVAAGRPLLIR